MPFAMKMIELSRDAKQRLKEKIGSDRGWSKAQRLWGEALQSTLTQGEGTQYKIAVDDEGRKITVVSENQGLFAGTDEKETAGAAKRFLNDKYRNKVIPLSEYGLIHIGKTGINKYLHSTNADAKAHIGKLKAAGEFENLLLNSEYVRSSDDKKNHSFADYGFDHYKTRFAIDGQIFEGIIDVGVSEKGAEFYGMTNVKRITGIDDGRYFDLLSSYKSVYSDNSSDNVISQPKEKVNTENKKRTQYKIAVDEKGNTRIITDRDITRGGDGINTRAKLRQFIKNNYDKISVASANGSKGTVYVTRRSAREFAYSDYSMGLTGIKKYDKFRVADNIDELLQSMSSAKYETPAHIRNDDIIGFYRAPIQIQTENRLYNADVVTAITKDYKEEFYDVVNMELISKNEAYPTRFSTTGNTGRSGRLDSASFNTSISQPKENVNTENKKRTQYKLRYTEDGNPVAVIDGDIYQKSDFAPHIAVRNYIRQHIGDMHRIIESGQKVYIGNELPKEYTQSKYTQYLTKNDRRTLKAKNQAAQGLGEMIEIASDRRWKKNTKQKHEKDAKYGFYKYTSRFAVPIHKQNQKNGTAVYTADLIIRNDADGKKYLYDVVKIKRSKEQLTSTRNKTGQLQKDTQYFSSDNVISQPKENVNTENEKNDVRYKLAEITRQEVDEVRSIGRKSVNDFTGRDIEKTAGFARKYYKEMGVKSPFFRAWFGDWRANDKTPVKVVNIDTTINNVPRGVFRNKDTGWEINVSSVGIGDTISHSGKENLSVMALNNINNIIENSVLLDSETSEAGGKKGKNTLFMHKLYGISNIGGKQYISKMTVEEYFSGADTNKRFYNLKEIKMSSALGGLGEKSTASTMRISNDNVSVSQLLSLSRPLTKISNQRLRVGL